MSVIGVARHNEVIDMILYVPPPPRPKSPMYVSEREIKLKNQKIPKYKKTFGFAETPLLSADCYLRKKCGVIVPKKPPVPDSEDFSKIVKVQRKIVRVKKEKKKVKQEEKIVDTPRGHKMDDSKYRWVYRKNYGKIPRYMVKQNEAIRNAEEDYRRKLEEAKPLCVPVSSEERQKLLEGLRHNRTEAQKKFLLLPLLTDTIPKVLYKSYLEKTVQQLEKDCELVERNPYIYLYE